MMHSVKNNVIFLTLLCMLGGSKAHAIVGGQPTTIQQHPWQVQIVTNDSIFCGGIIVSQNYILTARKCVSVEYRVPKRYIRADVGADAEVEYPLQNYDRIKIFAGNQNNAFIGGNGPSYSIDNIIEYPKTERYYLDVVLLHTSYPLELNGANMKAIEYEPDHDKPGTQIQLSGWGSTTFNGINIPQQLQVINDLTIINPKPIDKPLSASAYANLVRNNLVDINTSRKDKKIAFLEHCNGELPFCVVNVYGFYIPFYVEKDGPTHYPLYYEYANLTKWNPLFGLSLKGFPCPTGTGIKEEINNYYGSAHLKGIAQALDNLYGNVNDYSSSYYHTDETEDEDSETEIRERQAVLSMINRDFTQITKHNYSELLFPNIVKVLQHCSKKISKMDITEEDVFSVFLNYYILRLTSYPYGEYYKYASAAPTTNGARPYDAGGPITIKNEEGKDILIGVSCYMPGKLPKVALESTHVGMEDQHRAVVQKWSDRYMTGIPPIDKRGGSVFCTYYCHT